MGTDLVQLVDDSESLIDLEAKLMKAGHEFPSYKDYLRWLVSEWNRLSAERVNSILKLPPAENPLPTLIVQLDEIEYHLHGIVHGHPLYLAPGWQPRNNVSKHISKTVNSFHNPENGEDYLYESGMDTLFNLLKSQELKDGLNRDLLSEGDRFGPLSGFVAICILLSLPFIGGSIYVYSKTIANPQSKIQSFLYLAQKALNDERYQSKFEEVLRAQEMPQPFNLEKEYLFQKSSIIWKLFNLVFNKPNITTSQLSLRVARGLEEYAREEGVRKLHYLGGRSHTSEIAYFLQCPKYSFERLEAYRKVRKR